MWLATYINTEKQSEKEYLNDIQMGRNTEYYDNGFIKEVGKYEFGEKDGEWKKYNYNGDLIVTYICLNVEKK